MAHRRFVCTIGDLNPLAFGGMVVYRGIDGKYRMEYTPGAGDREPHRGETFTIYCIGDIEDDVSEDLTWVSAPDIDGQHDDPKYDGGYSWEDLGASKDVIDRAMAYYDVIMYYGPEELDQYPVDMTRTDLRKYRPYWPRD